MSPWQKSRSEKKTQSYEDVKLGTCRGEAVQLSGALCIQIGKIASGSQFWTTFFFACGPGRQCTQMSDWLPKEDKNLNWPHFLWKHREILISQETLRHYWSIRSTQNGEREGGIGHSHNWVGWRSQSQASCHQIAAKSCFQIVVKLGETVPKSCALLLLLGGASG